MDKIKNNKNSEDKTSGGNLNIEKTKKEYKKPRLLYYGGVKELTHSGTAIGTGDSANPGTRRP